MRFSVISDTIYNSIRQYRFKSIFVRNFIIYAASITLPVILLNILVLSMYTNQMRFKQETDSSISLVRLADTTVSAFDETANISYILSTNYYIQQFIDSDILSASEINKQSHYISESFTSFMNSNDYIDSIFVYSEKQNLVYGSRSSNRFEDYYDNLWHSDYTKNKDVNSSWIDYRNISPANASSTETISVVTRFFVIQTELSNHGLIGINIRPEALVKDTYNDTGDTLVFSSEGLSFINTSSLNKKQIKEISALLPEISYSDATKKIKLLNKEFFAYKDPGYNLYFLISAPPGLPAQKNILAVSLLSVVASLIIVLGLSITIGRKSLQPIEEIVSFFKNQTSSPLNSLSLNLSEVDYIINTMTNSFTLNQDLKAELSANLLSLQQYQIMALQAQINPHFLYNTLNAINISVMELTGEENDASKMLGELSALLRLALTTENFLIDFDNELNYLQRYINLQKRRWPDKFDVLFDVPDKLRNRQVLKFSLQPIVENSINHGIKKLRRKGHIIISAHEEKNNLKIIVYDDGVGIPETKLREINAKLSKDNSPPPSSHIGLINVNSRIRLMFGHNYGLKIESEEDSFTSVSYTVPIIKNEDFKNN